MSDEWELAGPHVVAIDVDDADVDEDGAGNNAGYLLWLDCAAGWHAAACGVSVADRTRLRRGMAARRIEIDYVRAALPRERVEVATWIVESDRKLRVTRRFQIRRAADNGTLARATTV